MASCDIGQYLRDHPFLSELIRKDGTLLECYGDAPPPSKDYGQILIKIDKVSEIFRLIFIEFFILNKVIVRWWKITLRNIEGSIYPGEIKNSYEDFYHDELAHREISRIFGERTLQYCLNFICGKFDWLSLLPLNIQIQIISKLDLDDIPRLSLVSKLFRSICRNNDLWKLFYIRQHGEMVLENKDLIHLAERRGWRQVFFTNRLKLQMELRREAQLEHHHPEDPSDLIKAQERQKPRILRQHSLKGRPFSMSPLPNREVSDISVISESLS